ncbi:DUF6478 family protein [Ruegeria sp. HKCCD7255]|uniref:DUF6478 family protein n=1 Tax=Ruegeria sp. HKCCD7255 TaxID=2683004 RepID=UPI001489D8CB|nr:DUF6478 family protein [Ruegeria sp. HKCCD7255]
MGKLLDRYLHRKALARWTRLDRNADLTPLPDLRRQRDQARQIKTAVERLIRNADGRLVQPEIGSTRFSKPLGSDWSWRPDLWRLPLNSQGIASAPRRVPIDGQSTLFHDCELREIALRQIRNRSDKDLAPFSLAIEVFAFEGSFLSLAVELPAEAANQLTQQHLVRLDMLTESERPCRIFARLNVQHGPNTDHVLRELDLTKTEASIDFDLAHLDLNERRIEKLWLDIILEHPAMNRVILRDMTFCRHHRADL